MFSVTDEDEFFNVTSNSSGSNLASLFGTSIAAKQNDGASLVYTAPKNPKLNIEEPQKSKQTSHSSVIRTAFVDIVTTSSDNNQTLQGKCGLAVIGNHSIKSYEVIVYKSKQDIIMRTKLKSDFLFTVQDNNCTSFYDDQKQQWSVCFENIQEVNNFVDEIKKCGGTIYYNLSKPNTVESKTDTLSKDSDATSDSSHSRTKASILSRMAKMGQPILPANQPIKQDDTSQLTDSETDESETVRKPTIKKRHKMFTNSSGEPAVKPNNTPSCSTPEYVVVNGQILPVSSLQSTGSMISSPVPSHLITVPNQLMISPPQLTSLSDPFNIFIAENRTHNCELRMNMTHLSSKLDNILAKIDKGSTTAPNEGINELQFKITERDKELAEKIQSLETLQKHYDALTKSNSNNQEDIEDYKQQVEKQRIAIIEQNEKIQNLTTSLNEQAFTREKQQQTIINLNDTIDKLKTDLKRISNNSNENGAEIEKLSSSVKILNDEITNRAANVEVFAKKLKQLMNFLYKEIMDNFEEDTSYSGLQIRSVLTQKIKASTFGIIEVFNSDFKSIQNDEVTNQDMNKTSANPIFL